MIPSSVHNGSSPGAQVGVGNGADRCRSVLKLVKQWDTSKTDRSDMANGGQASPIRRALCRAFQNSSSRPRLVRLRRAENSLPQLP